MPAIDRSTAGGPSQSTVVTKRPSLLPSLTGLRFVAAILVFSFHAQFAYHFISGALAAPIGAVIFRAGGYSVGFFFVLSGFVLTWRYNPRRGAFVFIRERLAKIGPNHLVTWAIALVLAIVAGSSLRLVFWLPSALLVQSWWPNFTIVTSANGVSWSLSCELLFYLSFPLIMLGINRLRERHLWPTLLVVAALTLVVALVGQFAFPSAPSMPGFPGVSQGQMWFVYWFPATRLLDFVLGILVAKLVIAGKMPKIGLLQATGIALGGYVLISFLPYLFGAGGFGSLWIVPLIVAAAGADVRNSFSPVRSRIWTWLGDISFPFYLLHLMFLNEIRTLLGQAWQAPVPVEALLVLGCLVVVVGLSAVLHHAVELPVVAMVRGLRRDVRPVPAVVTAAPARKEAA